MKAGFSVPAIFALLSHYSCTSRESIHKEQPEYCGLVVRRLGIVIAIRVGYQREERGRCCSRLRTSGFLRGQANFFEWKIQ